MHQWLQRMVQIRASNKQRVPHRLFLDGCELGWTAHLDCSLFASFNTPRMMGKLGTAYSTDE
jgi:hypothetical protein